MWTAAVVSGHLILNASSGSDVTGVEAAPATAAVHTVPLTFTPPAEPGLFEEEFVLKIEGRTQPVTFRVKGRILDQTVIDKK